MNREGIAARASKLGGCERRFANDGVVRSGLRDIDVLFADDINPNVHREQMPWLKRLAAFGRDWRTHIRTGLSGEAYERLLRRAQLFSM